MPRALELLRKYDVPAAREVLLCGFQNRASRSRDFVEVSRVFETLKPRRRRRCLFEELVGLSCRCQETPDSFPLAVPKHTAPVPSPRPCLVATAASAFKLRSIPGSWNVTLQVKVVGEIWTPVSNLVIERPRARIGPVRIPIDSQPALLATVGGQIR